MERQYEQPLPTPEEVLVCNPSTSAEEVCKYYFCMLFIVPLIMQIEVFWLRAINDPHFKRIFCLIHAEKLSYKVSDQALNSLSKHSQGAKGKC